jgi:hypothetical protein
MNDKILTPEELCRKQNRSGYDWALSFKKYCPDKEDERTLIAWFCNAVMSMRDSIANKELANLEDRIKTLEAENEKLIECVRFYADVKNWICDAEYGLTYMEDNGGDTARALLKELGKEK